MRRLRNIGLVLATLAAASGAVMSSTVQRESFEKAPLGQIAPGFEARSGRWEVVALASQSRLRNVHLSVRLRAEAGVNDQGGGLVWRARDARNYYVARFNPLEENFRVYKVVDGKRTQLQSAEAKRTAGWRSLSVWMSDDQIRCELDGRRLLEVKDSTFREPGMVGLWTKSDARTQFDDFTRRAFD